MYMHKVQITGVDKIIGAFNGQCEKAREMKVEICRYEDSGSVIVSMDVT